MTDSDPNLDRLADAIELFIRHSDSAATMRASDRGLLEDNAHLRDLLEPLLSDDAAFEDGDFEDGAPLPGTAPRRIGDYAVRREIGRGGMGVVYEAIEESLNRRVALKLLPSRFGLTARQIERFRAEAAAAARLDHPSIVEIHAVGESDGAHYIAMEYCEGQDLRRVLGRLRADCAGDVRRLAARRLTAGGSGSYFNQVAELIAQVAEALAYSHARGVIHRDIKPQNILVDDDGHAHVVDFGLAKDLDAASLSLTGDFAGTPDYISPEQSTPAPGTIDGRTDVFSLGVVLYELLTLNRPFHGETVQTLLRSVAIDEPTPVRRLSPGVPRDLETICHKALEKDRRRRYTAEELAGDLLRFLHREPIAAQPIGPMGRLWRLTRRHQAATLAAVLAFLLLVVAPIGFSIYYLTVNEQLRAETERARSNMWNARGALQQILSLQGKFGLAEFAAIHKDWVEMLGRTLSYYESLERTNEAIAGLTAERAQVLQEIGGIQFHLGRFPEAVDSVSRAIGIYDELFAAGTRTVEHVVAQAQCRTNRGLYENVLGRQVSVADLDAAAASFRAVLRQAETDERVRATAQMAGQEGLAMTLLLAAQVAPEPTIEASIARFDAAIEAFDDLVAIEGASWVHVASRARARITRGERALDVHRLDLVGAEFDVALGELRALHRELPSVARIQRWMAKALFGKQRMHARLGERVAAQAARAEALQTLRRLESQFPDYKPYALDRVCIELHDADGIIASMEAKLAQDSRWWDAKVYTSLVRLLDRLLGEVERLAEKAVPGEGNQELLCLARTLSAQTFAWRCREPRDAAKIEAMFERAIDAWRRLTESSPDNHKYAAMVGGTMNNFANYYLKERQPERRPALAVPLLQEAIRWQERAVALRPYDPVAQQFLRVHWGLLRKACDAVGDADGAAQAAREVARLGTFAPTRNAQAAEASGARAAGK